MGVGGGAERQMHTYTSMQTHGLSSILRNSQKPVGFTFSLPTTFMQLFSKGFSQLDGGEMNSTYLVMDEPMI